MRTRLVTGLAWGAAGLTPLVAVLVPFVLMGGFTRAVAHAGLRIDPVYVGGDVVRTLTRPGYRIEIGAPVRPHLFERARPFVQVVFTPASALPRAVHEDLDLDGDGRADVRVAFAVPADEKAPLTGSVTALNAGYGAGYGAGERLSNDSFSQLLVRVNDRVILRVPLARGR
jgi:hypothetical protein